MVNLPLGSPDVWAGGGVGLFAGLLLATSSSGCLLSLDCSVVHGRLTLRITTTQNPVKLPPTPVRDGIGASLAFCAIYEKNNLTEPESCIYQVFTSLTVTSKMLIFQ